MTTKIVRVQFRFDEELESVATCYDGYITSVSTKGEIVRTHAEDWVDQVSISLVSNGVTVSMGETNAKINLETARLNFYCREEERWAPLTIPYDDFSFYDKLFDKFDPVQLAGERVLQHFYHGQRSLGMPHGDGIGMWENGGVYVGRWCNGMPTYDCGFGLAHDGSMRWGSMRGAITFTAKGMLLFANEHGTLMDNRSVMPPFRRLPVHSVFRTHFSHWRTVSQMIASERMMRSLILSETTPTASTSSGKRSKKKNRNRRRNIHKNQTSALDVATMEDEEEKTPKVDEEEKTPKVDEEEKTPRVDVEEKTPKVDEEEAMCVICLENLRSHAIVPCGHMCLCEECAPVVTESCPMCREPMILTMRIYA